MTADDIADHAFDLEVEGRHLRDLLANATPGLWHVSIPGNQRVWVCEPGTYGVAQICKQFDAEANAHLIVCAVNALPALLDALEAERQDAERYRFLRSPLAAEAGPVQAELWLEMGVKLCREEAMDREVDAAMRLLFVRRAMSREGGE